MACLLYHAFSFSLMTECWLFFLLLCMFFKSILHFAAIFVAHYDMKVVGKVPIPYRMQELHSTYLAEHQDTNKIDLRGLINN